MSEQTFTVEGMTCAHCVAAVTELVGEIPGAERVAVDLASGSLTVRGAGISEDQVRAAIEEAGYSLRAPAAS